jgi:murein DD-endopeptidase MepM/ murein hydrolase activator NlpD
MPIDGKMTVTSYMGWRIHPIQKIRKHHNGTDIVAGGKTVWIEAAYDGKVVGVGHNPAGFGNSVTLLHRIDGEWYTTLYAHMADGSIQVKKGQVIEAGKPLGKMGSTGASTGRHLHWELHKGKKHVWDAAGRGYIEPVKFFKAVIKKAAIVATAPLATPEDAPTAPAPDHVTPAVPVKAAPAPVKPVAPTPVKPALNGWLKVGSKGADVKWLQRRLGITADGQFGEKTKAAVVQFQKSKKLKADGIVGEVTWSKL